MRRETPPKTVSDINTRTREVIDTNARVCEVIDEVMEDIDRSIAVTKCLPTVLRKRTNLEAMLKSTKKIPPEEVEQARMYSMEANSYFGLDALNFSKAVLQMIKHVVVDDNDDRVIFIPKSGDETRSPRDVLQRMAQDVKFNDDVLPLLGCVRSIYDSVVVCTHAAVRIAASCTVSEEESKDADADVVLLPKREEFPDVYDLDMWENIGCVDEEECSTDEGGFAVFVHGDRLASKDMRAAIINHLDREGAREIYKVEKAPTGYYVSGYIVGRLFMLMM